MNDEKVNRLMGLTMDKVKEMADADTVIGKPVTTPDGTVIIPISRISYGFASGGSDLPSKSQPAGGLFAGAGGAGITVSPVAFLTIADGNVRVLQIEPYFSPVDRALEKVPQVIDQLTALFKKKPEEGEAPSEKDEEKPADAPKAPEGDSTPTA